MPTFDRRELAAIWLGGAAGALLRVGIGTPFSSGGSSWPWATFTINLTGSFLLGYSMTRLEERLPLSTYRRPRVGTGFCGAYTTFSTMQVEVLGMLDHDRYGLATGYVAASLVAGYIARAPSSLG